MKRCNKCGEEKDLSGFHKGKGKCKTCRNEYERTLYAKKREHCKARLKEAYNRKKEWLWNFKKPCVVCGEAEKACIDFHHLDPKEKEFTISHGAGVSRERIKNEIEKCVCICANCHRKVHAGLIDLSAYTTTT